MAKFEENSDLWVFFGTLLSNFRQYRVNNVKRLMQLFFVEFYRISNNDDLDTYFFSCSTHPKKSLYMKLFSIFQSNLPPEDFHGEHIRGFRLLKNTTAKLGLYNLVYSDGLASIP